MVKTDPKAPHFSESSSSQTIQGFNTQLYTSSLCSDHFKADYILFGSTQKRNLNAVIQSNKPT